MDDTREATREALRPPSDDDVVHRDLAVTAVRRARHHLARYASGEADVSDPTTDLTNEAVTAWMETGLIPEDWSEQNLREVLEAVIPRVATVLVMAGWQPPQRFREEVAQ